MKVDSLVKRKKYELWIQMQNTPKGTDKWLYCVENIFLSRK